jgi:hypothetical protein
MRIAKPILLVTTPLGLVLGLREAYRLAGGLVVLMAIMVTLFGIGILGIVRAVKAESREARERGQGAAP